MKYKDIWKYCESCNDNINGPGITKLKRDNDFGYAKEEGDLLTFCFAGSNDFKDWMENIQFFKLTEGNTIHKGFYDAWSSFKEEVGKIATDFLTRRAKGKILVVGHSRGGAMAILCARHLAKNLKYANTLVTFGAPMLGDETYHNEFETLPIEATCLQNGWDIVCSLPPEKFGFFRVGKQFYLKQLFWHLLPWMRVSDHLEYKKILEKRDL
jgi:predicted lipase